jgi:uncharacterized membrane protein (DUF4010 family)
VQYNLGQSAILGFSFMAGLFELQGISLANATLFSHSKLTIEIASQSILFAIVASLTSKVVVSLFFGRNRFSVMMSFIFLMTVVIVFLTHQYLNFFFI